MSDKAFENVMNRIAVEAEAEREQEIRTQRRQQLFAKIRSACVFLMGAAILGCGYYYRVQLQSFAAEKFGGQPKIDGSTGAALKGIQESASKRDQVLNEITK